MSQTSLLKYFPSKSDLLVAVLERRDTITDDISLSLGSDLGLAERALRQAHFNERIAGVLQLCTVLCGEAVPVEHPGHSYFVRRFACLRDYLELLILPE